MAIWQILSDDQKAILTLKLKADAELRRMYGVTKAEVIDTEHRLVLDAQRRYASLEVVKQDERELVAA